MTFGEKVRNSRLILNLSQEELAEKIGVTKRSIINYEAHNKMPTKKTVTKLATALHVSETFLTHDDVSDPETDMEKDLLISEAVKKYGETARKQATDVIEQANVLFAGGSLNEEDKDALMRTLMQIYMKAKEENRQKYASRKKKNPKVLDE